MTSTLLKVKQKLKLRSRALHLIAILKDRRCGLTSIENLLLDARNGAWYGGIVPSRYRHLGAKHTQSTDYRLLDRIFNKDCVTVSPDDVLVDVGCGKGRVLCYWAKKMANKVYGIEIDPEIAKIAQDSLKEYPNVHIITGDAIAALPDDCTIFYLHHPFDGTVLGQFIDKLASRRHLPVTTRIFYLNSNYSELFDPSVWDIKRFTFPAAPPALLATLKQAS